MNTKTIGNSAIDLLQDNPTSYLLQEPYTTTQLQSTYHIMSYQYVLHKAVAEVSKIANYRRLVAVNHASQSKSTDGSKSGWRQRSVVVVVIVVAM